jgi:hypothetical protein
MVSIGLISRELPSCCWLKEEFMTLSKEMDAQKTTTNNINLLKHLMPISLCVLAICFPMFIPVSTQFSNDAR